MQRQNSSEPYVETARSTTEEGAGTSQIQLESGELQAVDFPWLSKHGAELKAGMWQKEKLKLLPAAQGNAEKGFEMGLKNLRVLCLTLCRERLEAAAQEGRFKGLWKAELAGGGAAARPLASPQLLALERERDATRCGL